MPSASETPCRECGAISGEPVDATGEARVPTHCAACGQALVLPPLRLRSILSEVVAAWFSADFPFWRTTRDLLRGPGTVTRAWLDGKRRTYVNPVKFLILIGVVVALSFEPIYEWKTQIVDHGQAVHATGVAHYAAQYFSFFCLVLLLPIALCVRAVGRLAGVRRPLLEWYALGAYTYGMAAGLQTISGLLELVWPPAISNVPFQLAKGTLPLVLFTWGAVRFAPGVSTLRALSVALLGQILAIVALALVQAALAA